MAGGLLGEVATILTDVRSPRETAADEAGLPYTVTPDDMALLDGRMLYIGFVVGFASVAALLVFAAAWKRHVETRYVTSTAARLVSIGFVVSAAGLTLGYGWKGALGNYLTSEAGLFDERGLFVYFMLTDFGPYIPWFGTLLSMVGLGWMAWRERTVSRVLGTVAGLYAAALFVAFGLSGVPGLAGPLGGFAVFGVSLWLSVGSSRVTLRHDPLAVNADARRLAPVEA
ncbi:hypothetical protein [Microbacterium sp.]|uniref:hypothetical protein n=1 Tax=Microbacterium sp. TaxID=51671 RepID=UPI003C70D20D